MFKDKKVVFSGVQPSGSLTIGNYLGAIKNFSAFSDEYCCLYCVVNEHAITVRQNPAELRKRTYDSIQRKTFFLSRAMYPHMPSLAGSSTATRCSASSPA